MRSLAKYWVNDPGLGQVSRIVIRYQRKLVKVVVGLVLCGSRLEVSIRSAGSATVQPLASQLAMCYRFSVKTLQSYSYVIVIKITSKVTQNSLKKKILLCRRQLVFRFIGVIVKLNRFYAIRNTLCTKFPVSTSTSSSWLRNG